MNTLGRLLTATIRFVIACMSLSTASAAAADHTGWERYVAVKQVARDFLLRDGRIAQNEIREPWLELNLCELTSEHYGTRGFTSDGDAKLFDIAGIVLMWGEYLRNFPERSMWEPLLLEVEKRMVYQGLGGPEPYGKQVLTRAFSDLVDGLEKAGLRARFPESDGCGAGGYVDVTFRTVPEHGLVSIVSEFDYELCRLSGVQNDHDKCTAWRVAKQPESVSGVYYIQVDWPERVEGPRRYDLNPMSGDWQDVVWLPSQ